MGAAMKEKERYELNDNDCIIDNEKDVVICDVCDVSESPETLVDLLNQQDKKIKAKEKEANTYAKEIAFLDNKIKQLKQQLHDLPKKIVSDIKDCLLDFSNGWWRYFVTDGCEYMLSSDLQGCLDEILDTILKECQK